MKPRKNNLNLCTVLRESLWHRLPHPSCPLPFFGDDFSASLHFLYFTTQDIKFNLHVCVCACVCPACHSASVTASGDVCVTSKGDGGGVVGAGGVAAARTFRAMATCCVV